VVFSLYVHNNAETKVRESVVVIGSLKGMCFSTLREGYCLLGEMRLYFALSKEHIYAGEHRSKTNV